MSQIRAVVATALLALAPAAAFADGVPEGHLHPHGLEVALVAALAAGAVWAARRAVR